MRSTFTLLNALLFAPLAAHAAETPAPLFIKSGVILVNHIGFPPNVAKHCVIPAPSEKEFTIHQLKDTKWTRVFTGALTEGGNELEPGWVGDFSAVKDDGIYQVRCGSLRSGAFTVHAGVYDVPMRSTFNYFTWAHGRQDLSHRGPAPARLGDGLQSV